MTDFSGRGIILQMIALTLFLLIGAAFGVRLGPRSLPSPSTHVSHTFPVVLQLERISELATTRVHIADILSAEGEGYRGSWLVVGEAILASDLSHAEVTHVKEDERRARIRLPVPRVISASVNHEKTRTWTVEKATWLPWCWGNEQGLRDAAMFHAQQLVETAAQGSDEVSAAKRQTEQIIQHLFQYAGWTVDLEWSDEHKDSQM